MPCFIPADTELQTLNGYFMGIDNQALCIDDCLMAITRCVNNETPMDEPILIVRNMMVGPFNDPVVLGVCMQNWVSLIDKIYSAIGQYHFDLPLYCIKLEHDSIALWSNREYNAYITNNI